MNVWLVVKHDGSLGPAGEEAVGPFLTTMQAHLFQQWNGPGLAEIETRPTPPDGIMSPEEYIAYMEKRI